MQRNDGISIEKAIEEINTRLEIANRCYGDLVPEYIKALELAVEALRKQEPVKPKACHVEPMYQGWHYQDQAPTRAARMTKLHFCPKCGQAVGWEE